MKDNDDFPTTINPDCFKEKISQSWIDMLKKYNLEIVDGNIRSMKTVAIEAGKDTKKEDVVNHPSHYTFGKYEVIDVLEDWFKDDPLVWQVGKYIARYKHKKNPLEDLKKAEFYLKRKISSLEAQEKK